MSAWRSSVVVSLALALALAGLALLPACGGSADQSKTSKGALASCASDADCVVTDAANCCPPCLEAPFAIPKLSFEQQASKCRVVECAPSSDRIECPKVESKERYLGRCQDGTCAAVKR